MERQSSRWLHSTLLLLLLLATLPLLSQNLNGYEYWFDQEFDTRTLVASNLGSTGSLAQTFPVAGLTDGFHTLHIRFRRSGANTTARWSAVSTYRFFKKQIDPTDAHGYEYWFDGDRNSLVEKSLTSSGNLLLISETEGINALADGLHTISLRVRSGSAWSAVSTYRFFKKQIDPTDAHGYEYWFDGDRNSLVEKSLTSSGNLLLISETEGINALADGLHTISLRVRSGSAWSAVSTYHFYKNSSLPAAGISAWEYWWNDDMLTRVRVLLDPPLDSVLMLNETIDMSNLCKGKHAFNIRFYGIDGWSSVIRDSIDKTVPRTDEEVADFDIIADGGLVSFENKSKNSTVFHWDFGDGQTSSEKDPYHTFGVGTYQVTLVAEGICYNDTLVKQLVIPGVSSYTPKKGGKNAIVTVNFTGVGFVQSSTEVTLIRQGQVLMPYQITVYNSNQMSVRFKFQDAPVGTWDVVVKFSGNQSDTIPEGFIIEESTYYQMAVNISSNWRMRSGVKNPMSVTITNQGNTDATWIPLTIRGFPEGTILSVSNERFELENMSIFDSIPYSMDSIPIFFYDSVAQSVFLPLILARIPAGQTVNIQIEASPPALANNQWFEILAESGESLYEEFSQDSLLGGCAEEILEIAWEIALGNTDGLTKCFGDIGTFFYDIFDQAAEFEKDKDNAVEMASTVMAGGIQWMIQCAESTGVAISWPVRVLNTALDVYLKWNDFSGDLTEKCGPILKKVGGDLSNILIGNSFDPNIKTGPGSGSASHFYATNSGPLVYVIQCENDTSALFAAQTVTIVDTLDLTKLDIATFRFTHVSVAGYSINLNTSANQFIRDIYLPAFGVIARVSGYLDMNTGVVTWVMRTIDPSTGQITNDPEAGILQPNFDPPEGDGSVGFAIYKLPDLPDDVLIENRAVIIFDINDPIVTNTWGVVSDNVPPVSQIDPLPVSQDSLNVHISWTGSDNKSGVQFYRIYVSDNGSPFFQWRPYESGINAVFTAQPGHSYRFYSLAVDSAGNVEAPPIGFDAEISIDGTIRTQSPIPRGYMLWQNAPNPFSKETRIDFSIPNQCSWLELRITDMTGKQIKLFSFENLYEGTYSVELSNVEFASGIYFYQLVTPEIQLLKRMIISPF